MKLDIKKIDISDALKLNTTIIIEMLHRNDLWEIQVPNIIDNRELINRLTASNNLVDIYTEILSNSFATHHYKNVWIRQKNRFICSSSTKINKDVVLPSTIEISDDFPRYGINRKMWGGDCYNYRGFGTVINGELISWAIENCHYLEDGSTEIGVETNVNNRKKGYAVSNVAALCDCLQKNGISTINYECSSDNIASLRTAQKANLEYVGEVFYLSYKK